MSSLPALVINCEKAMRTKNAILLMAGLLCLASSCQKEDVNHPAASEEVTSGEVRFEAELDEVSGDDARAMSLVSETNANGSFKGIGFKWNIGDTEPIHLIYVEGAKRVVVRGTVTFKSYNAASRRYKLAISSNAPAGMNLSSGQVSVAGAIGVSDIDAQGRATIPGQRWFYLNQRSYSVPMYFTPQRLTPATDPQTGQTVYETPASSLRLYGSLIGLPVDNKRGAMTYYPKEVIFRTDAFRTSGKMNLLTLDSRGLPTWTPDAPVDGKQYVAFDQGRVAIGQEKYYYFWIYPESYASATATRPLEVEFHADLSNTPATNGLDTEPEITRTLHMAQLPLHRAKHAPKATMSFPVPEGDIIITEVFMGEDRRNVAWEFYNPTEKTLRLSDYMIVRQDLNGQEYRTNLDDVRQHLYRMDSPYFIDNSGKYGVNPLYLELPPKKSAVYYSSGVLARVEYKHTERKGLVYFCNFRYGDAWASGLTTPQSSRFALRRKSAPDVNVDSFFWFGPNESRRISFPSATFMRKPERDTPRPYMQIKSDPDWVLRHRFEGVDWGRRFGYIYDANLLSVTNGVRWVEDLTPGANVATTSRNNGYVKERPLFDPDYSTGNMRMDQLFQQARHRRYTPPVTWTRTAAEAADGR